MKIGQIDEMHKMLVSKDLLRNQATLYGYQPIITVQFLICRLDHYTFPYRAEQAKICRRRYTGRQGYR